jgi:quercetin dioxygenase-like cupin family protein
MIENIYKMSTGDENTIEKVLQDENIHYIHMVFQKDNGLPEHFSNANVYMTVVRGTLSIDLNNQGTHQYHEGSLIKIPANIKMNVKNLNENVLELIVVKAPAPEKN